MNRLTVRYSGIHVGYKNKYNNSVLCSEMTVPQIRECMEKLAAYEDTGLEPEEVYKTIKAGVPEWIPKYLEYRKLEEQGLLIKLPMQLGELALELQDNILEKRGIFIDYGSLNSVLETLQEMEDN